METKNNYTLFLLNSCMYISLYFITYLLFFGFMGIYNPQIINLSRTAAITLLSFSIILIAMHSIYGRIDISKDKRRINNVTCMLSVLFTDIFTYIILQIMNVNPYNNASLILFGKDFPLLIACIALQFTWIYCITLISDRIFHSIFPALKACIITDSQENANHIYSKFCNYRHYYNIQDVVHYKSDTLQNKILQNDIIILYHLPSEIQQNITLLCYKNNKNMLISPSISSLIVSSARRLIYDDKTFLHANFNSISLSQRLIKRSIDIILSTVLLILLSPLLLFSATWIKCNDHGPIFFKQKRETLHGKIFNIIKFRTMYHNIDKINGIVHSVNKEDNRITKPGKLLRKLRIDELPQLFNILIGDMSFVGPRPEMLENAKKYTEQSPAFRYRLKVKGGLTGLAQIDGKYNTTFEDKLLLDLFYIENYSLGLDIKLMFRTLTVFFRPDSTEGFGTEQMQAPKIIF